MSDDFLDFDPNLPGNNEWATYIAGWQRNSAFKTHSKRGFALGRVSTNRRCKLYRLEPGKGWVLQLVKDQENMPRHCETCLKDMTDKDPQRPGWYRNGSSFLEGDERNADGRPIVVYGSQYVERAKKKKVVEPMRIISLCYACAEGLGY